MDSSQQTVCKKRKFNPAYEEDFLVVETPFGTKCLLCDVTFVNNRSFNFKRHYDKSHSDFEKDFPLGSKSRENEINVLKAEKLNSLENLKIPNYDVTASTAVSYRVTHLLIKSGKPFTDGQMIKQAFNILSEEFFNGTEDKPKLDTAINNTCLSARTVVRRLESMNDNILEQLRDDTERCASFSLQLDESSDVTDTAQINVFIRFVFDDMAVKEELFDILVLKGSARERNLHILFKDSIFKHAVSLDKLVAVTTDGAAAVVGKNTDFVALCKRDPDLPPYATFHCLIHQVSLCAKAVKMDHVVTIVVKIVNLIKARPLQHKLFLKLLQEQSELTYNDSSLHTDVRCLSLGKVLHQFLELLPHIKEFLNSKNEIYEELEDPKWLLDLNFLVDLTHKLDSLNSSLKGKSHTAWKLLNFISTFKKRLTSWINHFIQNKIPYGSFPNLQKCMQNFENNTDISAENFVQYLQTLSDNFETHFQDWKDMQVFKDFLTHISDIDNIDLEQVLRSLHNLDPKIDVGLLETEILNLQTDDQIRNSNLNIWSAMQETTEYSTLLLVYKRMLSIFGTTYLCESSFSTMKNIKSRYRSQITDGHLGQVMRMCTSAYKPDIKKLVKDVQCHSRATQN